MKKTVIAAVSMMLSLPVFSQTFIHKHAFKIKSQEQALIKTSSVDFSGKWVGHCDLLQDRPLIIKQDDKNIRFKTSSPSDPSNESSDYNFKFNLHGVKSKNTVSRNIEYHSLSEATWMGPNILELTSFEIGSSVDQDRHSTSSFDSFMYIGLELENDKLKVKFDLSQEPCVLEKHG